MRRAAWVALCWAVAGVACAFAAEPAEQDVLLPLMTGWKVKPAADKKELGETFFRVDFDDAAWPTADVKEAEDPYKDRYVFYRRAVDVPAAWQGKKITVVFGGVDDDAVVYWNGQKVGAHKGHDAEFDCDVTAAAKPGGKNLLAVLADNSGGGGCGIWRPVSLALADELAKLRAAREAERQAQVRAVLKPQSIPCRIVYETWRDDNWELVSVRADGSDPVNLTRTPEANELYPHVSPDGTKVAFAVDTIEKGQPVRRDLYTMNLDGTGRTKVAENAREGCWNPDGTVLAYLKGEFDRFTYEDYANKGVVFYDLATGKHIPHKNPNLHHLYNLCWSSDGNWLVATVHGGMGFGHAILAIQVKGTGVFNLGIPGCRPDLSPDGKRIAWGASDFDLCVADFDTSSGTPQVKNRRTVIHSAAPMESYHVDWSPDGKFVAFSRGGKSKGLAAAPEIIGVKAKGWNICVADVNGTNLWLPVTSDGLCNKEADWAPLPKGKTAP